jgi:F-type H+-transporting ATPase subunit b
MAIDQMPFVIAQAETPAAAPPHAGDAGTIAETPGEHKAFPPFDSSTFPSQLLWLAITFGLFYYLMAKVALPRIGAILEDRRDRIASDLDMAERFKQESEDAEAAYEKALAAARAKAFTIAETAREEAKAAAEAQRVAAEAALNKQLAEAESRIAGIKSKALSDVGAIAAEATEAIVASLTGAKVARSEVDAAVSGAMAE